MVFANVQFHKHLSLAGRSNIFDNTFVLNFGGASFSARENNREKRVGFHNYCDWNFHNLREIITLFD
jgi:hypothetical protein